MSPMLTCSVAEGSNLEHYPHVPPLTDAGRWLIQAEPMINRKLPLAVACSGGADSIALLLALAWWHPAIEVWHINHGWSDDSQLQAQRLAARCLDWGLPFRCLSVRCNLQHNREASARAARMEAFQQFAAQSCIHQLALAHHRDDQAETILMRLLKGAGVRGCRGIQRQQTLGTLQLLRPLLHISRLELRHALNQAGIGWHEDPSNQDSTLLRNRLRHHLLPAMDHCLHRNNASDNAADLLIRMGKQAQTLQEDIDHQSQNVPITQQSNAVAVSWQAWNQQPAPVRASILQQMAAMLFGRATCMGRRHIQLIEAWRQQGGHGGIDLSRSRLQHQCSTLLLSQKKHPSLTDNILK
ncbi:MAG: tRNA lysidine(34) synthetase TilS [Mariprofundales bacterium]